MSLPFRIEDQLQELYFHLDGVEPGGNTRLAWYAQMRAKEMSHVEALEWVIKKCDLEREPWYKRRIERKLAELETTRQRQEARQ